MSEFGSLCHCLDGGGMGRVHLRGEENIEKRYLIYIAGFNLGLLMRSLFGVGTPKGWVGTHGTLFILHAGGQGSGPSKGGRGGEKTPCSPA
jgi:hypothetical protein